MFGRRCPCCGANLDPCEICDCKKEEPPPGEQTRKRQTENIQPDYINKEEYCQWSLPIC